MIRQIFFFFETHIVFSSSLGFAEKMVDWGPVVIAVVLFVVLTLGFCFRYREREGWWSLGRFKWFLSLFLKVYVAILSIISIISQYFDHFQLTLNENIVIEISAKFLITWRYIDGKVRKYHCLKKTIISPKYRWNYRFFEGSIFSQAFSYILLIYRKYRRNIDLDIFVQFPIEMVIISQYYRNYR